MQGVTGAQDLVVEDSAPGHLPHSTEKSTITFFLQCFYSRVWQSISSSFEAVESCVKVDKGELET